MKRSEGKKLYTFYDGPPFATGLPHYGHIAAGTIKDVMTRYATMTGHHCSRRFGWDCHGLPIEYEIDKKYEIKSSLEREEVSKQSINSNIHIIDWSQRIQQEVQRNCHDILQGVGDNYWKVRKMD
jgi:isoleucyl-tRNA synthetase